MSLGLFMQQSGRALRPQTNKTAIILDHVGNYTRHGLPADDHQWSLAEKVKSRPEYDDEGKLLVRQCVYCYFTFKTGPTVCPNCGMPIESTRKELDNIQEIELKEITASDKRSKHWEEIMCKDYAGLLIIERKRGYKRGWAYFKAKSRGYKI